MNVAQLLKKRQPQWRELEQLCETVNEKPDHSREEIVPRFASLYRSACADLALAESNQLPPATVEYLHQLVAKAHNQLYRSERYQFRRWYRVIFRDTPRRIFHDPCVHIVAILFWGLFLTSAYLAYDNSVWPGFAQDVVGQEQLDASSEMFTSFGGRGHSENWLMFGFYIFHNAGIGLSCFVWMLFVLPGFVTLAFNSVHLGTIFGYMFRPEVAEAGDHFKNFVTAHGPFELTAIVLSSGAGLKIGLGWLMTGGLSRLDSLQKAGREALPIAMTAVALFCLAASIEGLISATPEDTMPWFVKGSVATFTSFLLTFYFVVLGFPEPGEPDLDFLSGYWDET